jgi:CBS domain-containing protein
MNDWTRLIARDVMTSPVVAIQSDLSLDEAATTLSEHSISGALVVDYVGNPVGVVTRYDLVKYAGHCPDPESLRKTSVAEVMSTHLLTVGADQPLPEVVATMARHRIHRLFVCDAGRPCGVISSMDLVRCIAGGPVRVTLRV